MSDPTAPGKWQYGDSLSGFYWVVALGPLIPGPRSNQDLQYAWSIVSSPFLVDLFVFIRDPNLLAFYYDDIFSTLNQTGFNKMYNSPLPTYQDFNCGYNWV
jgi:hypothetical protein